MCFAYSANFWTGEELHDVGSRPAGALRRISGKERRWKEGAAYGLAREMFGLPNTLRMHASVLFGSGEGALCIAYSANFGRGKAFMMSRVSPRGRFGGFPAKRGDGRRARPVVWHGRGYGLPKRFANARIRFVREQGKRFMHCISGGFLKERTFGMSGAGPRGAALKKRAAKV